MKNLIKLNIILLGFFIIFSSKSIAAERILPLPKPNVDQSTKIKTAKKKIHTTSEQTRFEKEKN